MKTAVIYARYSCDQQTEQSIDGQLRVCEEYAQRNNILILDTYIDRAMTGTNDNRPDFQRMLKDSNRKEWNYVLVYKLDRFSRNKYETAIHKKTLRDNGIKVLSAMENIPDTPEGIILESLLEGMNQYYSAELAQKVSRGMKETRRKGYFQGGTLLYGYKLDGRKIVVDENDAEVVRYIYNEYSKGKFIRQIIDGLTAMGIYYKGKPFIKNSVYNILRNEKYSGVYKHGEEIIDNMYPQIIPQSTFDIVRARVMKNRNCKRCEKVDFLLRHKLICGYCGHTLNGESGTSKSGAKVYYYKCRGRKKHLADCNKSMVRKDVLEELVINATIEKLSEPHIMNYIVNELLQIQRQQSMENAIIKVLEKQKRQVDTALNNLVSAVERGIISNTTNKRLHELEQQQAELEKQILIEHSKLAVQLKESDIREYYNQALKLEPQILINFLIKQITLFDDKIQIQFNSPIRISPDDEKSGLIFYTATYRMITHKYSYTEDTTIKMKIELSL
ncbi:MAG: recombinase family protein [Clostridia bacterium]|nr:recombinase family protein [Clostridia bacterium]